MKAEAAQRERTARGRHELGIAQPGDPPRQLTGQPERRGVPAAVPVPIPAAAPGAGAHEIEKDQIQAHQIV